MANTKLANLNLLDKFLFDEAMEDVEVYQATVSILLENEVELMGKTETEKEFRVSPELRGVRLDVVGMDRGGAIYYTEMQQKNTGNLIKRSRYYQAQLDVSLLEPGVADFNILNESCFILISPFDIFGKGLYRYTFEGVCRECPELKLKDGSLRVFINTKGKNRGNFSREFLDFMKYIGKTTDETAEHTESEKNKRIHRRVCQIRKSEKAGVKYMQRWEEIVYAREEGSLLKLVSLVCKKIEKDKTLKKIAEELEEEVSVIEPIYNKVKEFTPPYDLEKILVQLNVSSGK